VVAVGADGAGECRVSQWRGVISVAAGSVHVAANTGRSHTLGLCDDGTVLACGWNAQGQCDVQEWWDVVAIAAGWRFSAGLRGDGTLVTTGRDVEGQRQVGHWRELRGVSCGDWHTVAVRSDGSVCAAGNNTAGQCEMEDWHRVRAVSTGYLHTLGLLDNGTVRAAGRPEFWSGIESWTDITAVAAGSYHSVGLRADGTVVAAGRSEARQCDVGQLYKIAARTYTSVAGNEWINARINHFDQRFHHTRVNSGMCLDESSYSGDHRCLDIYILKRLSCARGVTANDVVLQIFQVLIVHSPLCHWPKSGIDSVDNSILGKCFQKIVTVPDILINTVIKHYLFIIEKVSLNRIDGKHTFFHILLTILSAALYLSSPSI